MNFSHKVNYNLKLDGKFRIQIVLLCISFLGLAWSCSSTQQQGNQQEAVQQSQKGQQSNVQSNMQSNQNVRQGNSANTAGNSNNSVGQNGVELNGEQSAAVNNAVDNVGTENFANVPTNSSSNVTSNIPANIPSNLPLNNAGAPLQNPALNSPPSQIAGNAPLNQAAPVNSTLSANSTSVPANGVPNIVPNYVSSGLVSAKGVLSWVGYHFKKDERQIQVQIVTAGNPSYRMFQEVNRAGQNELVVRFLNTTLRPKARRDIDATEFKSPVAYIRMRYDPVFAHTDVVMTLREPLQPLVLAKGGNIMFTFDIPEQWFAPANESVPVAEAEVLSDEVSGLPAIVDKNAVPGEAEKKTAAYVDDPGADAFGKNPKGTGAPLVPKQDAPKELVPASEVPNSLPEGNKILQNDFMEASPIEEIQYMLQGVAQGDFASDIPASSDPAVSDLLEDAPATNVSSSGATNQAQSSDIMGVSAGAGGEVSSQKKSIRLEFRDAPMSQILRMISSESGINFIVSPDAGAKKTSISLKNIPWDVALKAILDSNRLGMQEIAPGLVRVDYLKTFADDRDAEDKARQATEALNPTKILVMPLNYAKADDAARLAQTMLPKATDPNNLAQRRNFDRFRVMSDPRSNSIIVEATPSVLSSIKTLLERLDTQTPQVRIASRLVEMSNDVFDGLGVSWGTPFSLDPGRGLGFGSLPFPNYMTSQFSVDPGGAGERGGSAAFRFGSINNVVALDLKLRMFEIKRKAETLQTQDVVVQDNERAVVSAGSSDFIPIGGGGSVPGSLAEVSYNLSLSVTPHITADGSVQMKLDIRGDSPKEAASGAATAASKNTRSLTTTLLKRSGETAVIGGLYSSEVSKAQRGVPYLSSIPLFGALFRSTESKDSKKDLLIMVTPTIVGSNSGSNAGATGVDATPPMINSTSTSAANSLSPSLESSQASSQSQQQQQQGQLSLQQSGQASETSLQSNGLE